MATSVLQAEIEIPHRPLGSSKQSFRDPVVQARVHRDRDQFIASICDEDVCSLAASYHNGDTCGFFKPPIRGSYNICYFVQFQTQIDGAGDRWVVRVPLAPCLAFGSSSKLESEVATMQLIAENTTIPIPKIHAYAISDDPGPLSSFLMLQYIEGRKLTHTDLKRLSHEQWTRLRTSLAGIYAQLRRLEFPSIGCLTRRSGSLKVHQRTVSIDLNMQELEGLAPRCIQSRYYGSGNTLTSATKYVAMLLEIADNAFAGDRSPISQEEGEDQLYHLHIFHQYANRWANSNLDKGPFVLVHGDLELYNLLFDDNMDIVSVLDWEWSRVVPCQFFLPPLWLNSTPVEDLSYGYQYKEYLTHFDKFLAVLHVIEQEQYGDRILTKEWETGKRRSGFMVANALENWTAIDWFASRWINPRVYGGKENLRSRIKGFMQADVTRQVFIKRRLGRGVPSEFDCKRIRDPTPEGLIGLWKTLISYYPRPLPLTMGSIVLFAAVSLLYRRRR